MKSLIIKKWIEPYCLLETMKKFCEFTDYTFDGINKMEQMNKMYYALKNKNGSFSLYMKNVNKFYVFTPNDKFDLLSKLVEVFAFKDEDYEYNENSEYALKLIDIGKAEASFIIN